MSGFVRTQETDIAAPAGEVYSYVSDLGRHPEWADQPMTVEHVAGPERGPGATFRTHVDIALPVGHKAELATVVVLEDVDRRHVVYESTDSMGVHRWTIDLTDQGDRTHVTQRVERLGAPVWVRIVQPFLWRAMGRQQVDSGLAKLKERAERG